ncbi:hypothetical protein ACQP1G_21075 [Nocardia sp. CA-107356]|uniref:hypothetical protein n=1 Tax=Nocardia sp. CA-107356 TaxID=3239972 RepID=UPI003D8ABA4A
MESKTNGFESGELDEVSRRIQKRHRLGSLYSRDGLVAPERPAGQERHHPLAVPDALGLMLGLIAGHQRLTDYLYSHRSSIPSAIAEARFEQ